MARIPAVSKCPSGRRRKDTHLLVPRRRREAAKLLLVTPPRSPPSRSPRRCREAEAPALRWESEKFLISAPPRLCSCSPRRHRVAGKSCSPRRHREAAKLLLAALPRLQPSCSPCSRRVAAPLLFPRRRREAGPAVPHVSVGRPSTSYLMLLCWLGTPGPIVLPAITVMAEDGWCFSPPLSSFCPLCFLSK
jgi:hypothetical protein